MAFVTPIEKDEREFKGIHQTNVECLYLVGERDGKKVIQLNSYGSSEREFPNKLSQTLQFDATKAEELVAILTKEFGL
jgi:hypothetical protein